MAHAASVARFAIVVLAALHLVAGMQDVRAEEARGESSAVLSGTLARIARSGVVRLGYREDTPPFSFVSRAGTPAGYSLDLCVHLVAAVREAVGGRPVRVEMVRVTAQDRVERVVRGDVDIECGATTITAERGALVAFSPPIFITGTKLAVPVGARIRDVNALAGRRVAVVERTTNEAVLRDALARRRVAAEVTTVKSLGEAFALLEDRRVDAVAGDDILLLGHIVREDRRKDFAIVGPFLSFDRYALAYSRNDAPFADVVATTFGVLAAAGELRRNYVEWFQQTLPGGVRFGLPMGPELRRSFEILGQPPD